MPEFDSSQPWWTRRAEDNTGGDWLLRGISLHNQMQQQARDNTLKLAEFNLRDQECQARMKSELLDQQLKQMDIEDSEAFKVGATQYLADGTATQPSFKRPMNQERWDQFLLQQEKLKAMRKAQTFDGQSEIVALNRFADVLKEEPQAASTLSPKLSKWKPMSEEWYQELGRYEQSIRTRKSDEEISKKTAIYKGTTFEGIQARGDIAEQLALTRGATAEEVAQMRIDSAERIQRLKNERGPNGQPLSEDAWAQREVGTVMRQNKGMSIEMADYLVRSEWKKIHGSGGTTLTPPESAVSANARRLLDDLDMAKATGANKAKIGFDETKHQWVVIPGKGDPIDKVISTWQSKVQAANPSAAPAAPSRVRVRNKTTGQTGWWEGGEPPPEYEVVK